MIEIAGFSVTAPSPRMVQRRRILWGALAASLLLHVLTAWWVRRLPVPRLPSVNRTPITITFDSPAPTRASPKTSPAVRASIHPDQVPPPQGRMVSLPKPEVEKRPKSARFVSTHDQEVEKETRAEKTSPTAVPAHEWKDEQRAPVPKGQADVQREPLRLAAPSWMGAQPSERGWLAMWRAAQDSPNQGEDAETREESEQGRAEGTAEGPARDDAEVGEGGAPVNEDVGEVPHGTGTYLNARQWKYASYFNQISDAVRRKWAPGDVLRRRRGNDAIYAVRERFTLVEITLDRLGRVARVVVDRYSGADVLDDEALRAVRAAGPFPNPPEPLFEGHDQFSFRFGFTVRFERQEQPLLFRQGW